MIKKPLGTPNARTAPRRVPSVGTAGTTATATAVPSSVTSATGNSKATLSRNVLRVIPLGGLEEVGANMMAYEYGEDIIIVDCGFAFPDETTPGIDYIIPETKYLEDRKKNIRAMFITHGHMDHIGAIPYLLAKLGDPPIYTMTLSAGMIKKRLEEFNLQGRVKLNALTVDDVVPVGNFQVKFFSVNHNIPDSVGLSINTPIGQIIHTGDWKFDHTPINERTTDFHKIATFGGNGVLALMSDSTNANKPGYCLSEKEIGTSIERIFSDAKGRIVFASFSSLISRMQQVLDFSAKHNRKVIVTGRSMVNTLETAISLGYLKVLPKLIIKSEQAAKYPDNQLTILTTGAQGEEASQLARMSRGEHRSIKIKTGDTVIISSSPIPGNERSIVAVLDNLTRQGATVIYNKMLDIHTSGHAQQEELKLMMQLTKPKYFVPIHGEHHMLVGHSKLAQSIGIPEHNCFVLGNGSVLEFNANGEARVLDTKVESGYVFVDGLGVGDVGEVVIRDRQLMAQDGMFVIISTVDRRTSKLVSPPEILSRGFVYMKNNDELLREVKHEIRKMIESNGGKGEANFADLRQEIRDSVGEYLFQKTQRRPMILPVIIEV
ncbi:MAG TPA: ribonuclease J [Patescibacteria group bacterium]|jgi:ribonuclease J|nr:ribonuclease J [Patescibacteria group bacterium]